MTSQLCKYVMFFSEKCGSRVLHWVAGFGKMPTVKPNERRVALLKDMG